MRRTQAASWVIAGAAAYAHGLGQLVAGGLDDLAARLREYTAPPPPVEPGCTETEARWCPWCGTCSCRWVVAAGDVDERWPDPVCPLHSPGSPHNRPPEDPDVLHRYDPTRWAPR